MHGYQVLQGLDVLLINNKNSSLVTHQLGFEEPIHPVGPSATKWSLKYFCGHIKKGETLFPQAIIAQIRVTKLLLSPDFATSTCLIHFGGIILSEHCTAITLISSMFHIY